MLRARRGGGESTIMYFPLGWPREFGGPGQGGTADDPVRWVVFGTGEAHGLFASSTRTTTTLWSDRPRAVVAQVARCAESLQDYGENAGLHWRPDGKALAITVRACVACDGGWGWAVDARWHGD